MIPRLQRRQFLWYVTAGAGVVVAGSALVYSSSAPADSSLHRAPNGDWLESAPEGQLPSFVRQASPKVQAAYRYAVEHGEVLQYIPCFCGCTNIGHRHNGECYVAARLPEGRLTFTKHGAT